MNRGLQQAWNRMAPTLSGSSWRLSKTTMPMIGLLLKEREPHWRDKLARRDFR